MKLRRLRLVLVAEWLTILFAALFGVMSERPEGLGILNEAAVGSWVGLLDAVEYALFGAHLLGSLGCFFGRAWGNWLYSLTVPLGLVLVLFMGPSAGEAISGALGSAGVVLSGIALALIFSDS